MCYEITNFSFIVKLIHSEISFIPLFFLKTLQMLLYLVHIPPLHCAGWGWCVLNIFHKNVSNHRFSRWKWGKQIIPFIRLAKTQSENFIYLCFQNTIKQISVYFAFFFPVGQSKMKLGMLTMALGKTAILTKWFQYLSIGSCNQVGNYSYCKVNIYMLLSLGHMSHTFLYSKDDIVSFFFNVKKLVP